MGSRRKGRVLAFQAVFSWDVTAVSIEELNSFSWIDGTEREKTNEDTMMFARLISAGTIENIEKIDKMIKEHLEHWEFERISRVDLAILRMSVYSLLFQPDIPSTVTIDEAIDIVKKFGNSDSYRFINGVLDGIRKSQNL